MYRVDVSPPCVPELQLRANLAIDDTDETNLKNLTSTIHENLEVCDSVALFPFESSIHVSDEARHHSIAEDEPTSKLARALNYRNDINAQALKALHEIASSISDLA